MNTRAAAARAGIRHSPLRAPPQRWVDAATTICNFGEGKLLYPHVCTARLGLVLQMIAGALELASDPAADAIRETIDDRGRVRAAFEKWCRRPRGRGIVRKLIKAKKRTP